MDHGKTALVKCLTGIDTDRLAEEKQRGITIENGFAFLDLPENKRAGIVDVPGHEKFIRTMAAGAWGMDFVMLVIAADEGVQPQTEEHMEILSLLGIKAGVIVLTKCDLVSQKHCLETERKIRKKMQGTFLEESPIVRVSSRTGEGISRLKKVLSEFCSCKKEAKGKEAFQQAYLPIDRTFSMKGTGLVVTGTLAGGDIKKGEELSVYPGDFPVKVRGIQTYGEEVQKACQGQRTALNLTGEGKKKIKKGMVLAYSGRICSSKFLDVKLILSKGGCHVISQGCPVHLHMGTDETVARVFFLDGKARKQGEWGYAQLRLEKEVAVKWGQRFIIRFYSPLETIGGGMVLDCAPCRHKGMSKKNLEETCNIKETGSGMDRLALVYEERWGKFLSLEEASVYCGISLEQAEKEAFYLKKKGVLKQIEKDCFIHKKEFFHISQRVKRFMEEFHVANPLLPGMGQGELTARLQKESGYIKAGKLIPFLLEDNILVRKDHTFSSPDFIVKGKKENPLYGKIEQDYQNTGYRLFTTALYEKEHAHCKGFSSAFSALLKRGVLIRLNEQYCIHKIHYEAAVEMIYRLWEQNTIIETGVFRDALSCSRKTAISLLEYFDKVGLTKRTETGRIVKKQTIEGR